MRTGLSMPAVKPVGSTAHAARFSRGLPGDGCCGGGGVLNLDWGQEIGERHQGVNQ